MKNAVIFDMDGTLFDSEVLVLDCWELVAKQYQIENVRAICMKCLGLNAKMAKEIFLDAYGQHFPYDVYKKEMSELFHKKAREGGLVLKPGVLELLDWLKGNYRTAVASSTREVVVKSELELTGISNFFDVIIGGNRVEKSKPEPDLFLLAAELLGVNPKDCIVIEDSYNGIRAAYQAGMMPIMVPDLVTADEEMHLLSNRVCSSLFEVKEYLEAITGNAKLSLSK